MDNKETLRLLYEILGRLESIEERIKNLEEKKFEMISPIIGTPVPITVPDKFDPPIVPYVQPHIHKDFNKPYCGDINDSGKHFHDRIVYTTSTTSINNDKNDENGD